MDKNHAIVEQDGHVLIITLNRPEKRKALSPGMLVTVYEAWRQLDEDDNLRCAILTGAGGTFCSGADLSAMKDGNEDSEMMEKLKEIPEVIECHYTTGNWSIFAKIICRDNEHLMELLNKKIQPVDGVSRTETFISLQEQINRQVAL